MVNCARPFLMAGSRQAPDCQRPEISQVSMNSPGGQSSVFWSVYKPRDMYPRVLVSVHGSIVLTYPGRSARRPRLLHTFVAFLPQNTPPNPGLTRLLLGEPAPFGSGSRRSTNPRPRFGDV